MRFFILRPKESWIVDRFCDELVQSYSDRIVEDPKEADIIWAIADWCVDQLSDELLSTKKLIASVHHIVPEKFSNQRSMYQRLQKYVDLWHVPCESTAEFIRKNIDPDADILVQPFWTNGSIWYPVDRKTSKQTLRLPEKKFIVSSIQRDTEGHDLKSPKLEKGPDLFCDAVEKLSLEKPVHVLLGGWRRQYVMERLKAARIPYSYFELPPQSVVNTMYSATDLYIVASRCEGGPQSIVECALTKTPIVSHDVGIASRILAPESVGPIGCDLTKLIPNVDAAHSNVQQFCIPRGFIPFEQMLEKVHR